MVWTSWYAIVGTQDPQFSLANWSNYFSLCRWPAHRLQSHSSISRSVEVPVSYRLCSASRLKQQDRTRLNWESGWWRLCRYIDKRFLFWYEATLTISSEWYGNDTWYKSGLWSMWQLLEQDIHLELDELASILLKGEFQLNWCDLSSSETKPSS
jgi:hypothetical protein